jgi:hypothetical protein
VETPGVPKLIRQGAVLADHCVLMTLIQIRRIKAVSLRYEAR